MNIIVTCLFHLKSNFKKNLDTSGLQNRSPEVNALFKTITGILFLNLNCPLQFYLAENFISSIFNEILTIIPNDEEREKFVKFLNYFKKNYLNKKRVFFLGKVLNFQPSGLMENGKNSGKIYVFFGILIICAPLLYKLINNLNLQKFRVYYI